MSVDGDVMSGERMSSGSEGGSGREERRDSRDAGSAIVVVADVDVAADEVRMSVIGLVDEWSLDDENDDGTATTAALLLLLIAALSDDDSSGGSAVRGSRLL